MHNAPDISTQQSPQYIGRGLLTTHKEDETQLQIGLVYCLIIDFLQEDLLFFHVPNGGKRDKKQITRGPRKGQWYSPEGAKLKAMGALAGISDLVFMWPSAQGMQCGMIEIKTEDPKSTLTPEQKEVRDRVWAMGGRFAVARTYQQLRDALIEWGVKCQNKVTMI